MPIRSGAMQRPRCCKCGKTLRHRYDEVGLPCRKTIGSPSPTSTYAISLPRTRHRFFLYGKTAEIMLASPTTLNLLACSHCDIHIRSLVAFDARRWGYVLRKVRFFHTSGT